MYPAAPDNKKQKIVASFIVILAVVLVTAGVEAYNGKQKPGGKSLVVTSPTPTTSLTSPSDTTTSSDTSSSASTSSATSTSPYKDGTYSASSDYYVPNSIESIRVTLTIKNGVVADSRIQNSETDGQSAAYQEQFASEYKSYVVGKNIANIRLYYVAGASDTTQGFNDALNQIKSQAQA